MAGFTSKTDLINQLKNNVPTGLTPEIQDQWENLAKKLAEASNHAGNLNEIISKTKFAGIGVDEQINKMKELLSQTKELIKLKEKEHDIQGEINVFQKDIERLKKEETITNEQNLRYWKKQHEFAELDLKSKVTGLSYDEKRNKLLQEYGEKIGINTDRFTKGIGDIKQGFNGIKSGVQQIADSSLKLVESWGKVDQAAANYTKAIGGSAAGMVQLRKSTIEFVEK